MKKENQTERKISALPACAAEYIKLVIKKMRYRKKVRQDVLAELAAHFEDELKDCATKEEKEQKAQQLIADFGDAKLLAVLLRRAKKRCRPLWQKVLVRSSQALGIIVVYLLICFAPLAIGTPSVSVNYIDWLNNLLRAGRDDSDNALPYYKKATKACAKMPEQLYKITYAWPADLNDVEIQIFLKWIDDNNKAIELVREGTKKPYYWPVYEATGTDSSKAGMLIENIDFMENLSLSNRHIARALDWQSRYKAYKGDIESALSDCMVLQKFGSHFQSRGFLIEQLVGVSIEVLAHKTIFMILEKADTSADVLKNIQAELQEQYRKNGKVIDLEAEKAFLYDYLQRTFTDDGEGGGRVLMKGVPLAVGNWKSGLWRFVSFSYPDRREVTATIDEYFKLAGQLSDETPWQLHVKGQSRKWNGIVKECFLLKLLAPSLDRISLLSWRTKTQRAGLSTVLAVLRYKKEKGKCPANLDELVASGYLKALPIDPYSDKPLVYKKADNNFVLYGFGPNFKDDGGTVAVVDGRTRKWGSKDEGDWIFWPVQKK